MIAAGCDVGSLTAEAVILRDGALLCAEIIRVRPRVEQSASDVMQAALTAAGLSLDDIDCCVSTGYGRDQVPFADRSISEISCHAKGAQWLMPSVRTVIDVGGQDCKAIIVDASGGLDKFVMNDKCAAGTGRFLEGMSKTLGVDLQGLASLSLRSRKPHPVTSICSVFIETEVFCAINDGVELSDIAAGINLALATRIKSLVGRLGVRADVCLTGGVAKNAGVVRSLEELLRVDLVRTPRDPQIIGALGAALYAQERGTETAQQ
jgi:predicted CoA-substrate-specific enzyme activase